MPKLATLLQVRREMGITFVPYAHFRVQTRLSPEECAARLRAVTQPQTLPTLFSARTSPEEHLLLKGTVTRTGFFAVSVDNKGEGGLRKYRGVQPFWISGKFQPAFGGTDMVVQVFPSVSGLLAVCAGLCFCLAITAYDFHELMTPGSWERVLAGVVLPLLVARDLLLWGCLAIPASFQAYKMKNALRQLLSE